MTDIHAQVAAFLKAQKIFSTPGEAIIKAGIVPFLRNPYRYYVMKPVAKRLERGAPKFQLCKGTRMYRQNREWVDMKEPMEQGEVESLAATALREGMEELGLKLDGVARMVDVGPYRFASETTGKQKEMWLFAAEMNHSVFSDDVAETTAERAWLTLAEFDIAGRDDHRTILADIERKLKVFGA